MKTPVKVYLVYADDCNENDCGCWSESVDSIWFDEEAAKKQAGKVYHGRVDPQEVSEPKEDKPDITIVTKETRYPKLTIAKDRIEYKFPPGFPNMDKDRVLKLGGEIIKDLYKKDMFTARGQFQQDGRLLFCIEMYESSKQSKKSVGWYEE